MKPNLQSTQCFKDEIKNKKSILKNDLKQKKNDNKKNEN